MTDRIIPVLLACAVLSLASCATDYSVAPMEDLGPPTAPLEAVDPIDVAAADDHQRPAPTRLAEEFAAGLFEAVSSHLAPAGTTVVVLLPTDEAFAAMAAADAEAVLLEPTGVEALVARHLLATSVPLDLVLTMPSVPTRGGDILPLVSTGMTVTLGGATVIDVSASPGEPGQSPELVVLSIDRVLLPSV